MYFRNRNFFYNIFYYSVLPGWPTLPLLLTPRRRYASFVLCRETWHQTQQITYNRNTTSIFTIFRIQITFYAPFLEHFFLFSLTGVMAHHLTSSEVASHGGRLGLVTSKVNTRKKDYPLTY